jgi:hypothetical protein
LTRRKAVRVRRADDDGIFNRGNRNMAASHAVVRIDHTRAELHALGTPSPGTLRLHAKAHDTGHHHSDVRDLHEFFASVCDAVDGHDQTMVVGARHTVADFRRYLRKHRPETGRRVAAFEVADRLTDPELVALARKFFEQRARLGGVFGQAG